MLRSLATLSGHIKREVGHRSYASDAVRTATLFPGALWRHQTDISLPVKVCDCAACLYERHQPNKRVKTPCSDHATWFIMIILSHVPAQWMATPLAWRALGPAHGARYYKPNQKSTAVTCTIMQQIFSPFCFWSPFWCTLSFFEAAIANISSLETYSSPLQHAATQWHLNSSHIADYFFCHKLRFSAIWLKCLYWLFWYCVCMYRLCPSQVMRLRHAIMISGITHVRST